MIGVRLPRQANDSVVDGAHVGHLNVEIRQHVSSTLGDCRNSSPTQKCARQTLGPHKAFCRRANGAVIVND